jgi:Ca2+-transporting ATPase
MFLMLLVAAAIYGSIGERIESGLLLGSVMIVMLITIVQEFRAQDALRTLRELAPAMTHVIRSGIEHQVPAAEVVRGDTVVLREGDRVPADGHLQEGMLGLNESLISGESAPVERLPGQGGGVRAGTSVVAGRGRIEVTATGAATELGKIGKSLLGFEVTPSRLQQQATRAIRVLAVIALILAVLIAWLAWRLDVLEPLSAILTGIALAMAILPEEIPVVLTVFYALGARRIARHGVLTRRLAAVETIGAVSVLAVDKTGTLTMNQMSLARVGDEDGHIYTCESPLGPRAGAVVAAALAATPNDSLDPTDEAVRRYACGLAPGSKPAPVAREFPVGEGRLFVSRVFVEPGEDSWHMATKGAVESVLPLCAITDDAACRITEAVTNLAHAGYRVLAVALSPVNRGALPEHPETVAHELVGLVGLADPLRPDVPAAITQCRAAGIRVLMITGDHPTTAAAIARQAGLSCERILTGDEVARMDDARLDVSLGGVDVCARVPPSQKLRLVHSLQRQGEIVVMTGDGVNDAPALRAADVGVAMGARGADVAREAADLILLDDSFASLVAAIGLGRRIYVNVHSAIRFISAAHVPIIVLAIVPLLLQGSPLMLPAQIVLLEMIIDPACSVVFEAMPPDHDVMRGPPCSGTDSPFGPAALLRGVADGMGVAAILATAYSALLGLGVPAADVGLPVFLGLLASTVTLAIARHRGYSDAAGSFPWASLLVLLAIAIGSVVVSVPAVRSVMGFAEPTVLAALVPPACVGLSVLWLRWPSAAIAIRRWREVRRSSLPHSTIN